MAKKATPPVRPVVVYHGTDSDERRSVPRVVLAMIFSCLFNGAIIGAMFLIFSVFNVSADGDVGAVPEPTIIDTAEGPRPDPNFDNTDPGGLDPSTSPNVFVANPGEMSMPGPVDPKEIVGIPDATGGPPVNLPAPPGATVDQLGCGSIDDPTRSGPGRKRDEKGGMERGMSVPGGPIGRTGSMRQQLIEAYGGNKDSERAVALGLEFLASHQGRFGNWSLNHFDELGRCQCTGKGSTDNDIAATSLAILPFLGSGFTHKGGNSNKFTKVVDNGLRYLLLKQNVAGEFHPNMYAHALATIAVCEAYQMTSDPALRGPAQRALDYIVRAQSSMGGWRYAKNSPGYDTSVGGWQIMALKSGQMAGLNVPTKTLLNASQLWLNHAGSADGGSYGYVANNPADRRPDATPTLSAVGLLGRQYLGWGPKSPGLLAGTSRLLQTGPRLDNMYYTYYASQVMHHMGGPAWDTWNPPMRDGLIAAQDKGDAPGKMHQKGSWYNPQDSISGGYGGRIMVTSLSILTLEVYYRHLPLYRRGIEGDKELVRP